MTNQQLTQEILKVNRAASYKNVASSFLYPFINPLDDIELSNQQVDRLYFAGLNLSNADLVGLELMDWVKYMDLSNNNNLNKAANLTSLNKMREFRINNTATATNTPVIGNVSNWLDIEIFRIGNADGFMGDLSSWTKLREFLWTLTTSTFYLNYPLALKLPVIGNNKSLVTFSFVGRSSLVLDISSVGVISNLNSLTSFIVTGFTSNTSTVDNILSQLLTLKQSGSPLATVNISGSTMGIPTGGNNNTSAVALRNLGVTVTVRTV